MCSERLVMHQITSRILRAAEWKPVYHYDGGTTKFTTYAIEL